MRCRFVVFAGLVLGAVASAQQPPRPVFRAGVDMVAVDVHVVDAAGRPVTDLRPEDFVVSVGGKPRAVATADYVSHVATETPAADALPSARPRPLVSTNVAAPTPPTPGRTIMLVVDEDNIRAGYARMAAAAGERFLERTHPDDLVGFMTLPYGKAGIDPTTDRASVGKALQSVAGHLVSIETQLATQYALGLSEAFALLHDPGRWTGIVSRECTEKPSAPESCPLEMEHYARTMIADAHQRVGSSVQAFTGLLDGLAQRPGPKTVVLISQELPVSAYMAEQRGFFSEAARITTAAARAQVDVYILQIDLPLADVDMRLAPPSTSADAEMRSYGLETVTSLTGGRRMLLSGKADVAFARIALELSGYYLLGIRAETGDRDGKPHEITVAVKRRGVEVRARRAFTCSEAADAIGAKNATDLVNRLLRTTDAAASMPLAVTTYTVPRPPSPATQAGTPQVGVIISAEIDRARTQPSDITVGFTLVDAGGRNAGASVETRSLAPAAGHPDGPLCYVGMALVPPGNYTLRLAVADATLRSGSVVHAFTARPLQVSDLTLSDLVLLDSYPTEPDKPRPSVTAVATNRLPSYFEARTHGATTPALTARLEIADSDSAPARATGEMVVQVSGERLLMNGTLPLDGVPPGTYVARAVILADGTVAGHLSRPVRVLGSAVADDPGRKPAVPEGPPATAQPDPLLPAALATSPTPKGAAATAPRQPAATVEALLERVGAYVVEYGERMSVVIGVERYTQWMQADDYVRGVAQTLVSEFALFRVDDDWMGFRDVYEVDGKPVGDRQDRLQKLVMQSPSTAVEQGRRIAQESARYNLGAIQRNFNVPTTALFFIRPANQPRFRFRKAGEDRIDGTPVWVLAFEEARHPTIIGTSTGKDMPVTGTLWIDPRDGRVFRTRMEIRSEAMLSPNRDLSNDPGGFGGTTRRPMPGDDPASNRRLQTNATITVNYRLEPRLGLLVPGEMRESYLGPAVSKFTGKDTVAKIDCRATYSDFKRFETTGRVIDKK